MAQVAQHQTLVKVAFALATLALLLLSLYCLLVPNMLKDSRRRHLPPGPSGLPFVGNLFDLADSDEVQHKVRKWHQEFGDLFYTKIGGSDYVWLSSPKVVKDLMDKKSNIYSSRPPLPLAQDVASAGRRQLFMPYGAQWRQLRKHSHTLLNISSSIKYQPVQDLESKQVLRDLLDQPEMFYTINRRYSSSVIMLVTYGYRIPSFDDPLMKKIYTVLDNMTEMTAPGAHAVDSFPSLAVLPQFLLGNWYDHGKKAFDHDSKVYMDMWERLKRDVDAGIARDSFCKDFYLKDPSKSGIDDLLAAYTCGGLVEAGSETTATTLNNWILAMTLFPETSKKAQDEIDRVIGDDRLPQWSDEISLPYVRAMVKEVLRWRPVNKFGMLHATSEDDWYQGHFIPKGSVAVLNWWAIHRDPKLWKNPDEFDPERYLDKPLPAADYINSPDPYNRDHFTYGAGRRVCPGVHVAERSLYINMVRVLWGFNISKADGPDGVPIEPPTNMVPGFLTVPVPFTCSIKPRSTKHKRIMRNEFDIAEKEWLGFD
ncbi:cytochrome P450 [Ilyonectria robusta]|uniref:cytochrome P450 n=1 Tax=Ilyonectria robusta TaxID=1079257 RepID=UPI001E8EAA40|nr:cytochrome P450 [Ilyonectria robusta]KAH8679423.1 cytochrome P450 [Ilyonectria robusta]